MEKPISSSAPPNPFDQIMVPVLLILATQRSALPLFPFDVAVAERVNPVTVKLPSEFRTRFLKTSAFVPPKLFCHTRFPRLSVLNNQASVSPLFPVKSPLADVDDPATTNPLSCVSITANAVSWAEPPKHFFHMIFPSLPVFISHTSALPGL